MDFPSLDLRIREALDEDLGRGDLTSQAVVRGLGVEAPQQVAARVLSRQSLVLAGWPVFLRVFELLGAVEGDCPHPEGAFLQPGLLGSLQGAPACPAGWRTGGPQFLAAPLRHCHPNPPAGEIGRGLRSSPPRHPQDHSTLEDAGKVRCHHGGGGGNHCYGLDDAVLIKENHIALAGGLKEAVESCRQGIHHLHKIEVEVANLEQLDEALEAGCDAILLDNMSPATVARAVRRAGGRCLIEVSGGIDESNLAEYAQPGVDFISLGALTHSISAADISLLFATE